jgi:hypothetical protein
MRQRGEVREGRVFFDFEIGPWWEGFDARRGGVDWGGGDTVVSVPGKYCAQISVRYPRLDHAD